MLSEAKDYFLDNMRRVHRHTECFTSPRKLVPTVFVLRLSLVAPSLAVCIQAM